MLSFVKIVIYPSNTHFSGKPRPPGVCLKELIKTHAMGYREMSSTNAIRRYRSSFTGSEAALFSFMIHSSFNPMYQSGMRD